MQKEIFAKNIQELLKERHGLDSEVVDDERNNGVLITSIRLVFDKDVELGNNICIESFHRRYEKGGMCLPEIADIIACIGKKERLLAQGLTRIINDWESVKQYLVVYVRNAYMNEKVLEKIPHKTRGDLASVYCLCYAPGVSCITVSYQLMEMWGVTIDEIDSVAWENVRRNSPIRIENGRDVLARIDSEKAIQEEREANEMNILSNSIGVEGAVYILDNTALDAALEKFGWEGMYILPSSIHECILAPLTDRFSPAQLMSMVRDANMSFLSPEDVLSFSIYMYVDGELSVYDGEEWTTIAA